MRVTRRVAGVGAVAVLVAWILVVTTIIALRPDVGVASPRELQESLSKALNERNSDALAELIEYPSGDADGFAKNYLKKLDDVGQPQ